MILGAIVVGLARAANAVVFFLYYVRDASENPQFRPWHLARSVAAAASAAIAFIVPVVPESLQPAFLVILVVSFLPDIIIAVLFRRRYSTSESRSKAE